MVLVTHLTASLQNQWYVMPPSDPPYLTEMYFTPYRAMPVSLRIASPPAFPAPVDQLSRQGESPAESGWTLSKLTTILRGFLGHVVSQPVFDKQPTFFSVQQVVLADKFQK